MIKMKELKIGHLTARIPIIQGGMGIGVSLSGLASAVANQGGIGVISAAGIGFKEPDFHSNFFEANVRALRKEIAKAKAMTDGIVGVNIMVALSNFADMVKTSVKEGVDIIFCGAGLPLNLPEFLETSSKTKLVPIVSSGRAAKLITKKWVEKYNYVPDAVVVEGPLAGGHLGFQAEDLTKPEYALEHIVTDVLRELKPFEEASQKQIPVIAAGGIYSGEDIQRMLSLGAAGVQMATRFVATDECDAAEEYKTAYVNAKKEEIGIIKSPVGMPGRALMNAFMDEVSVGKKKPHQCPYQCIKTCEYQKSPFCISLALLNAQKGLVNKGLMFVGENAFRIQEIVPVKRLIEELEQEYSDVAMLQAVNP